MDESIAIELARLRQSVDKQNETQEEANGLLRSLIQVLQAAAQEIAELRDDLPGVQEKREAAARAVREAEEEFYPTPSAAGGQRD
jgi:hypothetical protein